MLCARGPALEIPCCDFDPHEPLLPLSRFLFSQLVPASMDPLTHPVEFPTTCWGRMILRRWCRCCRGLVGEDRRREAYHRNEKIGAARVAAASACGWSGLHRRMLSDEIRVSPHHVGLASDRLARRSPRLPASRRSWRIPAAWVSTRSLRHATLMPYASLKEALAARRADSSFAAVSTAPGSSTTCPTPTSGPSTSTNPSSTSRNGTIFLFLLAGNSSATARPITATSATSSRRTGRG